MDIHKLQKIPLLSSFVSLFLLLLLLLSPQTANAIMYNPGETLAPACSPTEPNCGVIPPVYTEDTITDGALLFVSSSAFSLLPVGTNGQVLKLSGGLPVWDNDAGGTSYTAGNGLSLTGSVFSLDLTNTNTWSGLQTFNSGFSVGGNTYTNLEGTGLSFSSGILSASLGTTIESSEITNSTIIAEDIANGTLTFAKIGQNSCTDQQVMKWDDVSSGWICADDIDTDNDTTYSASGSGIELTGTTFSLELDGTTLSNGTSGIKIDDTLVSQWNSAYNWGDHSTVGYITDGNTNWDNSYGFITGLNFSEVTNGTGVYLDYKPNDTPCTNNQVLKYTTGTGWICADDIDTDNNTTYSASGSGIELTGTTFSLELDGTSLALDADGLSLNLNNANTWGGTQTFSSALVGPITTDTINGLIINAGTLSNITGLTSKSVDFNTNQWVNS
jgi:hypothetical protein